MGPKFIIGDRVKLVVSEYDGYVYNRPLGSKAIVYDQTYYLFVI